MPANLHEQVMTAGVNGTTNTLLADFTSVVKQLKGSGDVTPEQAVSLTDLATQGFRIAQIEKLIENAATVAPDSTTFMDMQVQFEGKTYTIEQLKDMIGTPLGTNLYTDPLQQVSDSNPETANFINLYTAVKASGAMSNPQLEAYVNLLATEISHLSESTEDTAAHVMFYGEPVQSLNTLEASSISTIDSGDICQAGAGAVTGQNCTP